MGRKLLTIATCLMLTGCDVRSLFGTSVIATSDPGIKNVEVSYNTNGVSKDLVLQISSEGDITLSGETLTLQEISPRISAKVEEGFTRVVVEADKEVGSELFVLVLNEIRSTAIENVAVEMSSFE